MRSKSDGTLSDLNCIGSFTFWKSKQSGMHSINFVEMCASSAAEVLGYELLKILLPQGNFVDYVFPKGYHLKSFLKHVSCLAAEAFGCYSVLITLPVIFF